MFQSMQTNELIGELNAVLTKHGIKVILISTETEEPTYLENRPNPSPNAGSDGMAEEKQDIDHRKRKLGNLLNLIRN